MDGSGDPDMRIMNKGVVTETKFQRDHGLLRVL
jgi:hypothetical protein